MAGSVEKLVKALVRQGEAEWIEFKENNDNPQLIGEYLSALSNGATLCEKRHGYLVYGVSDKREIVGTTLKPSETKGKGNEDLEPWLLRNLEPRINFKIMVGEVNGEQVVIFKIDSAKISPTKFIGKAYVRIASHKKPLANHPEKERVLWNSFNKVKFEERFALEEQTSDEVIKKIDYPAFFDLLGMPLPDNRAGIIKKLEEENVIIKSDGSWSITNLGGILFAKSLKLFPSLVRKAPRIIIYSDESGLDAIREEVGDKGYAIGFEALIDWIDNQLPSSEIIKDAVRVNKKMYPMVAIREFVANALIHQDFTISGSGPMIEIFPTRIEITNPGKSLVDTMRFIDHAPRSRNEELASLMRRMNFCEERGSGVDRAVINIEEAQLPAPEFQAEETYTRVTLFSHKELKDMNKMDRMRACYQHCTICWLKKDFMSNASLRERLGIAQKNYPMVSKVIRDTLNAGVIKVFDPENRSTKKKYIPIWS